MSYTTDSEATVVRPSQRTAPNDDDATVVVQRRQAPSQAALASPPLRTLTRTATATATGTAQPTGSFTKTLAEGFALHEYRIDRVLGQGGFGITYLATDVHLNAKVAIKEFLPDEIARRDAQGQVGAKTELHDQRYHQGLESFLAEARTLASFRHPAIVRVARFFEAHNTAYMVLEYEQGTPFRTWWPANAARGEAGLIELLLPLLEGLGTVHAAGYLHRDIKPDNIQVRQAAKTRWW
jgi:serine/threonine protein kinase